MASDEPLFNTRNLRPWGGLQVERATPRQAGRKRVAIAGIPYDGAAFYRPGAALAPAKLRELSAVFPPVSERGVLIDIDVVDAGDAPLTADPIENQVEAIAAWLQQADAQVQLVIGGDHTVAMPSLVAEKRRFGDRLAVLAFDAHPDVCDVSHGSRFSIGCAIRRAVEMAGIPGERITMVGLRDFDAEEVEYIQTRGINAITMAEAASMPPVEMAERLRRNIPHDACLHVSLDIDVLDPAFAPGTEIPAAGGASTRQLLDWIRSLDGHALVGLDIVEVSPPLDHGDITSLAALKVIFEFLALVAGKEVAAG